MLTERTILAMSFLLGFWANLAQVAVLRLFLGQFYGTEIQVGLFLGVWLAGVALGGLLGGWRSPRAELVLGLMAVAPLVVLGVFAGGITALPARRGAFLPTWPVLGFLGALVLPLAVPGLISAGIFAFTLSWNEFIYALTFVSSSEIKTVPVGVVTELVEGDVYHWGALMAGALLGSLPVAIMYSFFVEYYVSGLTGAVKE
jgi:ABC-type maltose transport system permease subunit